VNGFLVGASITYGGFGYTNTPRVRIISSGGSGAEAVAVVSNGLVTAITILNPGNGYTSPLLVVAPPFIERPTMDITALSLLSFTNLAVGTNYQLQKFSGGTWLNFGPLFAALTSSFAQYVSGTASPNDYRLAIPPVPEPALATAQVAGGFVVSASVTSGGSGYTNSPGVIISGPVGSNATAIATVNAGSVTGITITSPGIGYVNGATITIAPPPARALTPAIVSQVMQLDLGRLSPFDNYQLESAGAAGTAWSNLGDIFTPTSTSSTRHVDVGGNVGFFRVRYIP
jgi:hypothetical protein